MVKLQKIHVTRNSGKNPSGGVNWEELAFASHYQTAVAVGQALEQSEYAEAKRGIEELIEALNRAEKRALKSQLIRLMMHVIKWKSQPQKRSRSWRVTIRNAREEIKDSQEDTPSLTREVIEAMWDRCFKAAKEQAEAEMDQTTEVKRLTWHEVFEKDYEL